VKKGGGSTNRKKKRTPSPTWIPKKETEKGNDRTSYPKSKSERQRQKPGTSGGEKEGAPTARGRDFVDSGGGSAC